jgi:hypothetical protein
MRHHAIEGGKMIGNNIPVPVVRSNANKRTSSIYEERSGTKDGPMPNAFTLNLRIEAEW